MVTHDQLHRTLKLDLDEGRASTIEEAEALAATYRLRIHVGAGTENSPTRQAALLTAVNVAARAFRGGVQVTGNLHWTITHGWEAGQRVADAITHHGGRIGEEPDGRVPTIIIGDAHCVPGLVTIHATWDGWAAGVTPSEAGRLAEQAEHPTSGVFVGALAVAEAFAHVRGDVVAGRRRIGLSLWDLGADWTSVDAVGPPLRYLPTRVWFGGLGHLGQAYLWNIGYLPYRDPADVHLMLQDYDRVVEANRSTGMLVQIDTPDRILKTRLAAAAIERLGFDTRITERSFDNTTRPSTGEPTWMLAGFDRPEPRRHLDAFDLAIDIGLGSNTDDYNGIHLHTLPGAGTAGETFCMTEPTAPTGPPAPWAQQAADDACGVLQLQGAAIGAAFVGAAATAIGVAQLLRALAGAAPVAVAAVSLSAPCDLDAVPSHLGPPVNPGYQTVS